MPPEQPVGSEWLLVVPGGVEHHLDDALHLAIRWLDAAGVDAQAAGDRGAHVAGVQSLAFDVAALDDILREGLEHSLLLKGESQSLHAAQQPALFVTDRCKRVGQALLIPGKLRPAAELVNVSRFAPHLLR